MVQSALPEDKVELRDGMLLLFAECVRQDGRWEDSVCQCQLQTHLNRGVSAASVRVKRCCLEYSSVMFHVRWEDCQVTCSSRSVKTWKNLSAERKLSFPCTERSLILFDLLRPHGGERQTG